MEKEDLDILLDWYEKNKDHKLTFVEKEAVKMVIKRAGTVEDLFNFVIGLLKK